MLDQSAEQKGRSALASSLALEYPEAAYSLPEASVEGWKSVMRVRPFIIRIYSRNVHIRGHQLLRRRDEGSTRTFCIQNANAKQKLVRSCGLEVPGQSQCSHESEGARGLGRLERSVGRKLDS